jgi:hypothetical protein
MKSRESRAVDTVDPTELTLRLEENEPDSPRMEFLDSGVGGMGAALSEKIRTKSSHAKSMLLNWWSLLGRRSMSLER